MIKAIALVLCALAGPALASGHAKTAPKRSATQKEAAADKVAATGPVSFGAVKLGMTKGAVEALQESDGVYLKNYLAPADVTDAPVKEGEQRYKGVLRTVLNDRALPATFTFEQEALARVAVELDGLTYESVKAQITEKYGAGRPEETRQEEQCIFKNGSNFKVESKLLFTHWTQTESSGETVKTMLSAMAFKRCPINLRYDAVTEINTWSLVIERARTTSAAPTRNLF